jgi:hypothetical protein
MIDYQQWNEALIFHYTSGLPHGTRVYLNIDNETLENIGSRFESDNDFDNWTNNFLQAVKAKVVIDNKLHLKTLQGHDCNGYPKGIAFLAATVLAANEMAEDEEISEINYFKRLREIFSLKGSGRPPGMAPGSEAEEPLWKEWNSWLIQNGFETSAQRGKGRRMIYISYPISQSLLRRTDKDKLLALFNEKHWKAQWDAMTLFSKIRCEVGQLPLHLKELLTGNKERYEAIADSIHEVYQQWKAEGRPNVLNTKISNFNHQIFAGLYRDEDIFFGSVSYYLYPKQVRGQQFTTVELQHENKNHNLINERPGWYSPLEFGLGSSDLDNGNSYQITQPSQITSLILPSRDFWILIPDPNNLDAGTYATWGQPLLGTSFILLCKKELLLDMQRLRDENLISWNEQIQPFENSDWIELHQCMVLSQAWDGIFIKNQLLKDALQPSISLSISFSDGLPVPQQNAWVYGYTPKITIFGFYPNVELQVTQLIDNSVILDKSERTNIPITIDFPNPGDYMVRGTCGNKFIDRFIRIVDWNNFYIDQDRQYEYVSINSTNSICGSTVK